MLKLTVTNVDHLESGDPTQIVLYEHGLVIGRAAHADWTLPDPKKFISSIHCEIDFRDGQYLFTDCSTNGSLLNGGDVSGQRDLTLSHGDILAVGDYSILVETEAVAHQSPPSSEPFAGAGSAGDSLPQLDWGGGIEGSPPSSPEGFGGPERRAVFQSTDDPMMRPFDAPAPEDQAGDARADSVFGLGGAGGGAPPAQSTEAGSFAADLSSSGDNPMQPAVTPAAPTSDANAVFGLSGIDAPPTRSVDSEAISSEATSRPDVAPGDAAKPDVNAEFRRPPSQNHGAADIWASLAQAENVDFGTTPPTEKALQTPGPDERVRVAQTTSGAGEAVVEATPAARPDVAADALAGQGHADDAYHRAYLAFLTGMGLSPQDFEGAPPEEVMAAAGGLLWRTSDGLIKLLATRRKVRQQFGIGVDMTVIQSKDNNPLKWAVSTEDACRQLVGKPDRGFSGGPSAVQNAFEDVQAHEMALIVAMRDAIKQTILCFSPERLESRAEKGNAIARLLPGQKKAALWEAFEREFARLADETEAAYVDLFAKYFRQSYERTSQERRK